MRSEDKLAKDFDEFFWSELHCDCYSLSCEARDCCECSTYQEYFEVYKEELGYIPGITVGLW